MTSSRRSLLTGIVAALTVPAMARAECLHAIGSDLPDIRLREKGYVVSASVKLPGGQRKLFSCSLPNGQPVEFDTALACVCDRNGVDAWQVADLKIERLGLA
jgi:hypothetical protein